VLFSLLLSLLPRRFALLFQRAFMFFLFTLFVFVLSSPGNEEELGRLGVRAAVGR